MSDVSKRKAMPEELAPCPFCGSHDIHNVSAGFAGPTNVWHAGDEIFAVNCGNCGASVLNRYTNQLVVDEWNHRTPAAQRPDAARLAQQEERNFCPRCGKRTTDIHTCTPPRPINWVDHEPA